MNMNIASNVISLWTRFFHGRRKIGLLWLPEDILVDEILARLNVKDILVLRLTCRILYRLTRQPAIWRRFLPHLGSMTYPLPLLPPMNKYTPESMSYLDVENWISRAVSLDEKWKQKRRIRPTQCETYEAYYDTSSMVMLPGGQFLVASVRDGNGKYGLLVWAMDHPAVDTRGPVALVWRDTDVKAYNLQARYTVVGGVRGVSIAFLRKWHKDPSNRREIPETHRLGGYGDPEDPYMPLRYECTTLQISLDTLDRLTDRKLHLETYQFAKFTRELGDPFKVVSRVRTGTQLGAVTLSEVDGQPHVIVVKRPNSIVFDNLNDASRSTLTCEDIVYVGDEHHIWNIRFLPEQNQIFVVRAIERVLDDICTHILFEFYERPLAGKDVTQAPVDWRRIMTRTNNFVGVQIAEIPSPLQENFVDWPQLRTKRTPSPLSIYTIESRLGFVHYTMWPICNDEQINAHLPAEKKTALTLHYSLETLTVQSAIVRPDSRNIFQETLLLPGASRAIISFLPFHSRSPVYQVKSIYTYACLDIGKDLTMHSLRRAQGGDDANADEEISSVWPVHPKPMSAVDCKPLGLSRNLFNELNLAGITAIAYDESSGQICLATKNDRSLTVLDFAYVRQKDCLDKDFMEWQDSPLNMEILKE